tara:strand:- start:515 stop:877 length:363 start_codon:yes stop_codon:yes gene_type:complete
MSYIKKIEDDYVKGVITLKEISKLRVEYRNASREIQREMDLANAEEKSEQEKSLNPKKIDFKKASQGWVIVGFIASVLGGWGGLILGINYIQGNYNETTKIKGVAMVVICIVMWTIRWNS